MSAPYGVEYEGETYPVTLVYSVKRRTLGLTVKADGSVIVRMPPGYPEADALAFAQSKAEWIAKHVTRFKVRTAPAHQYQDGDTISFLGTEYTIRRVAGNVARAEFSGTELLITIPPEFAEDDAIELARTAVIFLFRREGTARLKEETACWAERCGVEPPQLRVRVQTAKWGCCTPKNGIILNVKLMQAPTLVISYLIVHEVCHLKHRNHQKCFWNEVERLMPAYRQAEEILKSDGWKWVF